MSVMQEGVAVEQRGWLVDPGWRICGADSLSADLQQQCSRNVALELADKMAAAVPSRHYFSLDFPSGLL